MDEPRQPAHVPALDGLRGTAILLVMLCHFTMLSARGHGLRALALAFTNAGWAGVDLFFVLSGFLITGILHDSKDDPHYFRNFYARRVLRILPLYYGALTLIFVVGPAIAPRAYDDLWPLRERQGWFWLHLSNVLMARDGAASVNVGWLWLSHFWSLATEEHFYAVWPLLVLRLDRRQMLRICVMLASGAFVIRTALYAQGFVDAGYVLTPCRLDALAAGGFCALAIRACDAAARSAVFAAAKRVMIGAGTGLAAIFLWRGDFNWPDPLVGTVGLLLLALFFAGMLLTVLQVRSGPLVSRPMRALGRYSYATYVFHLPVSQILGAMLPESRCVALLGSADAGLALHVALCIATSVGLAVVSWNLFERRILRLKDQFYARPAVAAE